MLVRVVGGNGRGEKSGRELRKYGGQSGSRFFSRRHGLKLKQQYYTESRSELGPRRIQTTASKIEFRGTSLEPRERGAG